MLSILPQLLLRNSAVSGRRLYSTVEKQAPPIITETSSHSLSNPMENYIIQQNLNTYEMLLKYGANLIAFPLAVAGFFEVQKNYQSVVMNFGKFHSIADEGLRWRTPLFTTRKNVFIGRRSYNLTKSKIVDANGNPIIVSGIVNYNVEHPENFVFNIDGDEHYLNNQAEAILKKVASKYPYESKDDKCLTKEGEEISRIMKDELQNKMDIAGIHIHDFYLTDICYSEEIAQQMLIRQRALAYIDAKEAIGHASVDIVKDIVDGLEDRLGHKLMDDVKDKLVLNLTTVITAESGADPVLCLKD